MSDQQLRVVSMQVRDVLGAREFALEPGKAVTALLGRNGSGKSTALGALQAALQGGSLAKLARVGAEGEEIEPEVVLVLEGSAGHYRVERDGKKVRVRRRVGDAAALEDVPQPQSWLSGLFDGQGSNPVRFLTAPDKERALLLLEALPLRFDRAECLAEIGITEKELAGFRAVPAGVLHPLEETARIREAIYEARRGINRDRKSAEENAEELKLAMPATLPEDQAASIEALDASTGKLAEEIARAEETAAAAEREAIAAARAAYQQAEDAVVSDFTKSKATILGEHTARAAEIRADAERRIAEDLKATTAAVDQMRENGKVAVSRAETERDDAIVEAQARHAQARERLESKRGELAAGREKLAALRESHKAAQRALILREQVAKSEEKAGRLSAESERLTRAIDLLDAHRRKLAEDLPIEGLEIDGAAITVNGIPYEQLNTAQRVRIAVQVATLRAKGHPLPLVFVDGAEALDGEQFGLLVQELKRADVQAFVARVEDHDFATERHDAPAEVVDLAEARQ